jgi:hypothetical protein
MRFFARLRKLGNRSHQRTCGASRSRQATPALGKSRGELWEGRERAKVCNIVGDRNKAGQCGKVGAAHC